MKRKLFCGVLLAAALFVAWMLWPRDLAAGLDAAEPLSAFVITSGVEITREEGVPSSRPFHDVESYDEIPADSAADSAIRQALESCSYHLCLDSLTGNQGISDIGKLQVNLYAQNGWEIKIFSGTGKIYLNDRIVRIDYRGHDDAARLCEALTAALRAQ